MGKWKEGGREGEKTGMEGERRQVQKGGVERRRGKNREKQE